VVRRMGTRVRLTPYDEILR